MTETLLPIVQKINGYLSDYILVALLIAVGLWYSIKTRFVQVRHFKEGWNSVFGSLSLRGGKQESGMSSFQALATAIAAQVGTGNIVGASGAILTGGPGAIFWMWVIAFLGMATIYAEATLAQETRTVDKDGKILAALTDATQPKITADKNGQITGADFKGTKRELGADYGMVAYGNAIAEWDAQAKAFADYTVGKTAAEVAGIETVESNGHNVTTDETLYASCTMDISGMIAVIALAANYAR